jgi:DNA-binding IclR family transcriptional regulator
VSVQTLDRAIQMLRLLGGSGGEGMRLIDLEKRTGLTKPTVHRILKTLGKHGFVFQHRETRRYLLGQELAVLGWSVANAPRDLRELCQNEVVALADQTGDTAFLMVRSGFETVCVDRRIGSYPIRTLAVDIGTRRQLCVGAGGLAILASLDEEEVEQALNDFRQHAKRYANTSIKTIRASVEMARQKGYGYSDGQDLKMVRAVGVAILNGSGEPIGALSIGGIRERIPAKRIKALVEILHEQRSRIERRLNATRLLNPGFVSKN